MKKLMAIAFVVMFSGVGSLMAAQIVQPWILQSYNGIPGQVGQDSNGNVTVSGQGFNANAPIGLQSYTVAQVGALIPFAAGQIIVVSNPATFNAGTFGLCVSSGTGVGAYIQVSSAAAVTACK